MTDTGVDASFSHQDAAQLAADGVKAIGRYAPPSDPGKTVTADELVALHAHGVAVWLVYEQSADRWRGGYVAGQTDGKAARTACRAIGWPDTRPIYTAYDTNVGPIDDATATSYQRGFNDGQALAGARCAGAAYGDGYILRRLTELGLIGFKWLSDSTAFTESAQYARSGQASIIQYYGRTLPALTGIDVDDLLVADFGQDPAPAAPPPTPAPRPSEGEMFMFQERGSAAVNVAGVGARGYVHIPTHARLIEWKAALVATNPSAPFAGAIIPVSAGFAADLAAGAAGQLLAEGGAPAVPDGPAIRDVLPPDAPDTPITDF